MGLPAEIILHILKHLVSLLSIPRILRLRLVNTLFAKEIPKLLPRNPTAQDDALILKQWLKVPLQFKQNYIRAKIDLHSTRRSVMSTYAHDMLNTELARTSSTKLSPQVPFVDRIVDVAPYVAHDRWDLFDPDRYELYMQFHGELAEGPSPFPFMREGIEETALIVLAISTMIRDEADTLSWAIDAGADLGKMSMRLMLKAAWLAPKFASKEIATVIVESDKGFKIQKYKRFGKLYEVLDNAASVGNFAALEVWIEYLRRSQDEHLQFNLAHMMQDAAMKGESAMVEFLDRWFEGDTSVLLYNTLIKALDQENISAMAAILEHGGFDRGRSTKKFPRGPIFRVMMKSWRGSPLALLETLLKGGIDPDGRYPGVMGTALQRAVEKGDVDRASMLIKYGADVSVSCIPHRMRKRSPMPLLLLATRRRNDDMVRLLLNNGADPTSVKNDKNHGAYIQDLIDGKEPEKHDSDTRGGRHLSNQ